jgi:ppGpp synthetase/RelA/SpoT-type nucleotidyltranferase
MKDDLLDTYTQRYESVLRPIAANLEILLGGYLGGIPHVDRIVVRAKSPERFVDKARKSGADGKPKYDQPLSQIQDQIGARVIVFYKDDVEPTCQAVLRYFRSIEDQFLVPDTEWEFGYFGKHLILALLGDAVPKEIGLGEAPRFFELQIKTLFQHAWSEANHDLGYKSTVRLKSDQIRRLAFTSAQAWGADEVFSQLYGEIRLDRSQE